MIQLSNLINNYTKNSSIAQMINISLVVIPTLISIILVAFSQAVRVFYDYSIVPTLLVIPFIVFFSMSMLSIFTMLHSSINSGEKKDFKTGKVLIIYSLLILLITFRFIGIVWGSKYLSPIFEAQYISGHAHIDTLFHSAIGNMLLYFGHPAIGVEGVIPFHYHYGSHLVMVVLSRFLHLSVLQTYHLVYPSLILPLLVGLFLLINEVLRQNIFPKTDRKWLELVGLAVFFLSISGIMPEKFRDLVGGWNNIIISESYAFSIMFLYFLIAVLIKFVPKNSDVLKIYRHNILYVIAFFGAIGLTAIKISVGTLWCVGFSLLWFSDKKNRSKFFAFILTGTGWGVTLPFIRTSEGMTSTWNFGHFILTYVDWEYISYYLIVNYGWTLLALFIIQLGIRTKPQFQRILRVIQLILGGVAIVGALPGIIMPIDAGSAFYFSNVNIWVSLPIVAVFLSSLFSSEKISVLISSNIVTSIFLVLLLFSPIITPVFNTLRGLAVFKQRTATYINEADPVAQELWNILSKITQDKNHIRVLEFDRIPPYGSRGLDNQRTWMTTYLSAAAISGIPTLNNIEETDQLFDGKQIGWGFDGLLINKQPNRIPKELYTIHILHRDGKLVLSEE